MPVFTFSRDSYSFIESCKPPYASDHVPYRHHNELIKAVRHTSYRYWGTATAKPWFHVKVNTKIFEIILDVVPC